MSDDFDDNKDVLVAHVGDVPAEGKGAAITVNIKSYDDGPPKIRLNRTGAKKDGSAYIGKIGSIDAREARALALLFMQAADLLDAASKAAAKADKGSEKTEKARRKK